MRAGTTILLASTAAIALVAGCAEPEESEGTDEMAGGDESGQEPGSGSGVGEGEGAVTDTGTTSSGPMSEPWSDA